MLSAEVRRSAPSACQLSVHHLILDSPVSREKMVATLGRLKSRGPVPFGRSGAKDHRIPFDLDDAAFNLSFAGAGKGDDVEMNRALRHIDLIPENTEHRRP